MSRIRLYIYRDSQADGLRGAVDDGALRYIDTFETTSTGDVAKLESVKQYIEITAECIDMGETIVFVEESVVE